jgi:hypothetical protein
MWAESEVIEVEVKTTVPWFCEDLAETTIAEFNQN